MNKKILLTLLLAIGITPTSVFSQSLNIIENYKIDTTRLFNEIRSKFDYDCNKHLADNGKLLIFPFYLFLDTVPHSKKDYLNYSFLKDFEPIFHTTSQIIQIDGYTITDSLGCVLGLGGRAIDPCCYPVFSVTNTTFYYVEPTQLLYDYQLDFVFRTCYYDRYGKIDNRFLYGINMKEDQVYVVVDTRYGSELIPIEVIVNNYWDDFQNGLFDLCREIQLRKEQEYNKSIVR